MCLWTLRIENLSLNKKLKTHNPTFVDWKSLFQRGTMWKKLIFLLLIIYPFSHGLKDNFNCLDEPNHWQCHWNSHLPYKYIENLNSSHPEYPGCVESKIWLYMRHGTKCPYVVTKAIEKAHKARDKILNSCLINKNCSLSADLLQRFQAWTFAVGNCTSEQMSVIGRNEIIRLAKRLQSRYPTLMPSTYEKNIYQFRQSIKSRCKESTILFATSLFGSNRLENVEPAPADDILMYNSTCEKWSTTVIKNPETFRELHLFKNSTVMNNFLAKLTRKLGFPVDYKFALLIEQTCIWENAWETNTNSPWCDLLTLEDFKIFDYMQDLDRYWSYGPAYSLSPQLACILLNDMLTFFESSTKTTSLTFAHSEGIMRLATLLGVGRNSPHLLSSSFDQEDSRTWRAAHLGGFNANMIFVLYNCESSGPSIVPMLQERKLNIPGCPENVPCSIETIKQQFRKAIDECTVEKMCSLS